MGNRNIRWTESAGVYQCFLTLADGRIAPIARAVPDGQMVRLVLRTDWGASVLNIQVPGMYSRLVPKDTFMLEKNRFICELLAQAIAEVQGLLQTLVQLSSALNLDLENEK